MKYIVIIAVALLLSGCRAVRTEVVTEVRTVDKIKIAHDSVYLYDSVFVDRWRAGETIYFDRNTIRYKYINRVRVDTLIKRDSLPYPVEVVKYKTKRDYTAWWFVVILLGALWASIKFKK